MFINCGKAVQMLCFRGHLPIHRSVERKRQVSRQWNNIQISTIKSTNNTQSFPPILSPLHPCLNTFFTQFPQHLLLLRLIKN